MKGKTKRKCDNCGKEYFADNRNLKRGWGLCCSKSCSASKREKSKPNYDPKTVSENNERRKNWNKWKHEDDFGDYPHPFSSEAHGQE